MMYDEVMEMNPADVIDAYDDVLTDSTDVLVIAFDDGNVHFVGDTGLFRDQAEKAITILLKRYLE